MARPLRGEGHYENKGKKIIDEEKVSMATNWRGRGAGKALMPGH